MIIINPLYDQAFKYLMDNEQLAKKVVSIILEQEVISIQSKPNEIKLLDRKRDIPLSRFDFKAIIRGQDNKEQNVLIEIQKSKHPDPIMRFRRYLGKNYLRKETYINQHGEEVKAPLPIITIYILGYNLTEYNTPGLLVNNQVIDAVTKQPFPYKNEFIELLTHPSYILQVERLRPERKTRLEKFLSLFDQSCIGEESYLLDIEEDNLSEVEDIAQYLNRAVLDEAMIQQLEFEEDYEGSYETLEKQLEAAQTREEEAKKREVEAQKQEEEAKKREVEAQKREVEALKQKETAIINLYQNKMSITQIAVIFQIKEVDIQRILLNNEIKVE